MLKSSNFLNTNKDIQSNGKLLNSNKDYTNVSQESLASNKETFVSHDHAIKNLEKMRNMCKSGLLVDVVILAGGDRIPAHRLVLSSVSDYFFAMFTGNLKESSESEVYLEDINPTALRALVEFCYSGKIDINEDNVEVLFSTATILQISQVVKACSKFLASHLNPCNCIGIATFAEFYGCTKLNKIASLYTTNHFIDVIKNQEFLQLCVEELKKLLSSDMLNVPCEEIVFDSLMAWLNHDKENRKQHIPQVLEFIRLPLLSPQNKTFFLKDLEI